ncbi:hypothetical protein BH20VER1_BH20VER1_22560 [soil metagenome]
MSINTEAIARQSREHLGREKRVQENAAAEHRDSNTRFLANPRADGRMMSTSVE